MLFAGGAALRDASGMVGDVVNGTVAFGCAANNVNYNYYYLKSLNVS